MSSRQHVRRMPCWRSLRQPPTTGRAGPALSAAQAQRQPDTCAASYPPRACDKHRACRTSSYQAHAASLHAAPTSWHLGASMKQREHKTVTRMCLCLPPCLVCAGACTAGLSTCTMRVNITAMTHIHDHLAWRAQGPQLFPLQPNCVLHQTQYHQHQHFSPYSLAIVSYFTTEKRFHVSGLVRRHTASHNAYISLCVLRGVRELVMSTSGQHRQSAYASTT